MFFFTIVKIDEKQLALLEETIKQKYKMKYKEKYELLYEEAMKKALLEIQNSKIHKTPTPTPPTVLPRSPSHSPSPPSPQARKRTPSPVKDVSYIEKSDVEEEQEEKEEEEEFKVNQEVLAQWPDDGWYYKSEVVKKINKNLFEIRDLLGDEERINKDCLISLKSSRKSYSKGDYVVALHPEYDASYAPGKVVESSNKECRIHFYDSCEDLVKSEEVFAISREKYDSVIDKIEELEKRWVGKTVVVKNDDDNVFEKGLSFLLNL